MSGIKGLPKGLDPSQDHDLSGTDTPPDAINVWFDTDDVYLPTIVKDDGTVLRSEKWEKHVYWNFSFDLGHSEGRKRVNDKVKFNEETGKWDILKLAPNGQSHISAYPDQWNAFYDGLSFEEIGTPLEILFPQDKGRIKHFKRLGIHTVERLGGLTEGEAALGGMGVLDDSRRARNYIERMKEGAKGREVDAYIKTLEAAKQSDNERIQMLEENLARLMAQLEEKAKPAKKTKVKEEEQAQV